MLRKVAEQQAQAEGLTLRVADNKTGYFGVHHLSGRSKPYKAQVQRGGTDVHLGYFATADPPAGDRATHSAASSAVAK